MSARRSTGRLPSMPMHMTTRKAVKSNSSNDISPRSQLSIQSNGTGRASLNGSSPLREVDSAAKSASRRRTDKTRPVDPDELMFISSSESGGEQDGSGTFVAGHADPGTIQDIMKALDSDDDVGDAEESSETEIDDIDVNHLEETQPVQPTAPRHREHRASSASVFIPEDSNEPVEDLYRSEEARVSEKRRRYAAANADNVPDEETGVFTPYGPVKAAVEVNKRYQEHDEGDWLETYSLDPSNEARSLSPDKAMAKQSQHQPSPEAAASPASSHEDDDADIAAKDKPLNAISGASAPNVRHRTATPSSHVADELKFAGDDEDDDNLETDFDTPKAAIPTIIAPDALDDDSDDEEEEEPLPPLDPDTARHSKVVATTVPELQNGDSDEDSQDDLPIAARVRSTRSSNAVQSAQNSASKPTAHQDGVTTRARNVGGRRRANHAIPLVEAAMRRQLEIKQMYRAIVRPLKVCLGDLAQKSLDELETDEHAHLVDPEYMTVMAGINEKFERRKAQLLTAKEKNREQLRERYLAEISAKQTSVRSLIDELKEQQLARLEYDIINIMRTSQLQLPRVHETEDEDGVLAQPRKRASKTKRSVAVDPKYDSRSRRTLEMERRVEDLEQRTKMGEALCAFKAQPDQTFSVMDRTSRDAATERKRNVEGTTVLARAAAEVQLKDTAPFLKKNPPPPTKQDLAALQALADLATRPELLPPLPKAVNPRHRALQPPSGPSYAHSLLNAPSPRPTQPQAQPHKQHRRKTSNMADTPLTPIISGASLMSISEKTETGQNATKQAPPPRALKEPTAKPANQPATPAEPQAADHGRIHPDRLRLMTEQQSAGSEFGATDDALKDDFPDREYTQRDAVKDLMAGAGNWQRGDARRNTYDSGDNNTLKYSVVDEGVPPPRDWSRSLEPDDSGSVEFLSSAPKSRHSRKTNVDERHGLTRKDLRDHAAERRLHKQQHRRATTGGSINRTPQPYPNNAPPSMTMAPQLTQRPNSVFPTFANAPTAMPVNHFGGGMGMQPGQGFFYTPQPQMQPMPMQMPMGMPIGPFGFGNGRGYMPVLQPPLPRSQGGTAEQWAYFFSNMPGVDPHRYQGWQ
ncbi:hypothetical protein LTR95_012675 [Oleoguttula sp. CCFEE 5521]